MLGSLGRAQLGAVCLHVDLDAPCKVYPVQNSGTIAPLGGDLFVLLL